MALQRIDQLGAPDYGALHGTEGVVIHTPENGDPSIEAAIATARWQATSGNSSGGSYHGILGHDADLGPMSDPDAWVLVKSVPFGRIAGSISTRRDAIWAPERYPWIAQLLSPAAYADPNAYLHALSLGGNAAWWSTQLGAAAGRDKVRGALVTAARWIRRWEQLFDYDAVVTLHRHWQTNRSDPDGLRTAELILDEYEALYTAAPAPTPEATVTQLSDQLADRDATIERLRRRLGRKNQGIDATITAANAAREV